MVMVQGLVALAAVLLVLELPANHCSMIQILPFWVAWNTARMAPSRHHLRLL